MPILSVITPASRGVKQLSQLLRDFRNQTFTDFEHCIVYDGEPPQDVIDLMKKEGGSRTIFCNISKDLGNMKIAPGTAPRNHGVKIASGKFVVFCDDDDRYKDTYLEKILSGTSDTSIGVVQMSCQESRIYKNGDPNKVVMIPEIGLKIFPVICHVGTPCYCIPRSWALAEPWRHEPEHDFRFIKRICEKFDPIINLIGGGFQVDVDGIMTRGMRDWVSRPPFWRN